MRFEINVQKKQVLTLLVSFFLLAGTLSVIAYDSNNPPVMGHTSGEVNFIDGITLPFGQVITFFDGSGLEHTLSWVDDNNPQFEFSDGLEVHGNLRVADDYNLRVHNQKVCLADGTDCPESLSGSGAVLGGGWDEHELGHGDCESWGEAECSDGPHGEELECLDGTKRLTGSTGPVQEKFFYLCIA